MKKLLIIIMCICMVLSIISLSGCDRQSDKVSRNLSLEADNFNIVRQVTVMSLITNDVLFQMSGRISIETFTGSTNGGIGNSERLEIVVQDGAMFKKHFVLLGDNTTVIIEDLGLGANAVSSYKYTLNYNPKMWIPVDVKTID